MAYFTNIDSILGHPGMSVREMMVLIDRGGTGIGLIVDADRRLIATISDGDVRRGVLAGRSLDAPVQSLIGNPSPISARATTLAADLLQMMRDHGVQQIPLLDSEGRVVDLVLMRMLHDEIDLPLRAVLMAGGFGTRLHPLTDTVPKPMLPVGGKPLMELTIKRLRQAGIRRVSVTTHYLPQVITDHFGDGSRFGVDLSYVQEDRPLGTAGALSLLEGDHEPLLVMNGDVVTDLDFASMLDFHREHRAALTMAMTQQEFEIPYGVVEHNGAEIIAIREKPRQRHFVNAGIYLIEPHVLTQIPPDTAFSMVDLMERLIAAGHPVVGFPIREYWLDIGQHADYQRAQRDLAEGRVRMPQQEDIV